MNMNDMPLISVVVPVYGTEQYLRRCLDSILNQTYKNIELIIVNDGSKDHSESIIREYLQNYSNIKYVRHKENKGLFQARVSGAEEATGDYIAFVDSDDYISIDFYRLLIKKAESTHSDIVVSNTVFEEEDGTQTIRQLYQLCFEDDIIEGKEIQKRFFEQKGFCFSWHTVWNKLYKKSLWDVCFPHYKKLNKHIIMTEDIAFSSLILYHATKLSLQYHANYFYCQHPNASTNSSEISFEKFQKNMLDMKLVFDFVDEYFTEINAENNILNGFLEFRKKYSRMWRSLQILRYPNSRKAEELIDNFLPGYKKEQQENEFCFDVVSAKFNNGLDYAKNLINKETIEVVSFDIFDTLICRPFYAPTDIFLFMDPYFDKITHHSFEIAFSKMRIIAEKTARKNLAHLSNGEDVTLTEIYDTMKEIFSLPDDNIAYMYDLEKKLELEFCKVRECGKELYDFAVDCGKRVIIISDMYLEYDTVTEILKSNGYSDYEKLFLSSKERCLKYNGALYKKMLQYISLSPEKVLHIGDTWSSDITGAQKIGIQTFFLPKAREAFENTINGIQTNNCAWTEKYIYGPFSNDKSARKSLGYRSILAMIANKFFDNPFVSFNENSDFNCNPYWMGYYLLGTHCFGLVKWIKNICTDYGYKNIYFLARDGFLLKEIFDIYQKKHNETIETHYMLANRIITLPYMITSKADLYDLPVETHNHTPLSICDLLQFCLNINGDIKKSITAAGFSTDYPFSDESKFYSFINYLSQHLFDEKKLQHSQKILNQYYSKIKEDAVLFDIGYSGRIQQAVSLASGSPIDAIYVHTDKERSNYIKNKRNFRIHSFYDHLPASTGILREYLLSEQAPACNKIELQNGELNFQFEENAKEYPDAFIIREMQTGAIDFINDYMNLFSKYENAMSFNSTELSSPFEYFLRFCKHEDRKIFSLCELEDKCYGNISSVRMDRFFNNNLCDITPYELPKDFVPLSKIELEAKMHTSTSTDNALQDKNVITGKTIKNSEMNESKTKAAIFLDIINDSDSEKDKFSKCVGNTGNLIDWNYICEELNPEIISSWYMSNPGGFELNDYDIFLTTGLSCVEENTDLSYLQKVLERIGDKILFPLGIGLSSKENSKNFRLSPDSIKVLCAISERCKSIGVKGTYTAEILHGYGIKNIEVIGTPSMYRNIAFMKKMKSVDKVKKTVSTFRPFFEKITIQEKKLLGFMMENDCDLMDVTPFTLTNDILGDDGLFSRLKSWEEKKKIFFDIEKWKKAIDNADFAFGMNFQNNMIAIQCGIPSLLISYESVGRELCQFYGIPSIDIAEFDDQKDFLYYYKMADMSLFISTIDEKNKIYVDFLKKNNLYFNNVNSRIIDK